MSNLELKIPPVLLVVISAMLMWLAPLWFTEAQIPSLLKLPAAAASGIIGLFFLISGVISFRQAKTTIDPTTPDAASSLVTSGIYKHTRNAMYVGLLFILIGWGLFLSSLCSLALLPGFVLYMNRFQIRPEERALEAIFGEKFLTYKNRVRRWL